MLACSVILGAGIRSHLSDSKDKQSNETAVVMEKSVDSPTPVLFDLVTNFIELQSSYGFSHNYSIYPIEKESQRQQQPVVTNDRASPALENSS